MRNYVIINGVNSLTIQGLAIKTLPPITKPIQRNLREEIDGRDGDIVTTLGYGAYDKTIEIGLFGTFDIDEVIAYFNQKGTITFSNELDKVYNFQALEQVDYAELLKFRTANVVLHCQPFKYPTEETPLEEEYEYVTGTGTDITLDNTEASSLGIELKGNTSQVSYTGKQVINLEEKTLTTDGVTCKSENGIMTITGTNTNTTTHSVWSQSTNLPTFTIGETYTLKANGLGGGAYLQITYYNGTTYRALVYTNTSNITTFTIPNDFVSNTLLFIGISGSTTTINATTKIMLVKGTYTEATMPQFEPYVGGIPSPNPNYPQDIHVVSGDNTINICGKNLYDGLYTAKKYISYTRGTLQNSDNWSATDYIVIEPNTTYTLSGITNSGWVAGTCFYNKDKTFISSVYSTTYTFTTPNNAKYVRLSLNSETPTNVMLEKGSSATTYEPYQGNTYPLYLGVENLAQITATGSYNCTLSDGVFTSISYSGYGNIRPAITQITLPANKTIYYSADIRLKSGTSSGALNNIAIFGTTNTYNTNKLVNPTISSEFQRYIFSITPTIDEPAKGLLIQTNSSSSNAVIEIKNIMISYSYSHDFYEYGQTPVEMASIPNTNYRDIFVKENGSWYKRKKINKRTLDGTESAWGRGSSATTRAVFSLNTFSDRMRSNSMEDFVSDKFSFLGNAQSTNLGYAMSFNTSTNSNYLYIQVPLDVVAFGQIEDFKTWLSNHVTNVYYILEEAEDIEITNTTLADQLEAIKNAISSKGQTNISQTNNDMPFVLDLSALKENSDHLVIDNIGNIYSKPTLDLEGTGIVDIYLNDTQMFEVDLSEKNEIVIDTEKMEAYNPTDNTLANRQVTGDYSKFKLDSGENDLRFSGDLSKATITRYERWL